MTRGFTFVCAVLSICGLALTAQAQMESPHQAQMAARLMQQQGNIDLPTAIKTAEQHTQGKAITADAFVPPPWQTAGTEQLKYAVTVAAANNRLQTVFIDGRTGHVESVQPAVSPMGPSGFRQGGYGQPPSPYQQQPYRRWNWQQQPGWQWQQGQPRGYGGFTPGYGGQFNQPQYWGPQQQWQGYEPEEDYEAQGYPQGQQPYYGAPPQGWAGQYGQPMGMPMVSVNLEQVSKIIGDTVVNQQNQDIGRIDNLAINMRTGRVPFVVLNSNNKLYPIPIRLIHRTGSNQVALNFPQDRLQNLPALNPANWPESVNERLVNAVHEALGLRPEFGYAGFRAEGGVPPEPPATQPSGPGAQPGQVGALPIRKATDLMNQPVHNPQGEKIGTIKDLVIDPHRAHLAYVIVNFNNMGDKLVAVPWDIFSIQQGRIMLNANPSSLQQAQSLSFSSDNWPDMNNPEWAQREAQVWGTPPYPVMAPARMMGGMHPEQMRGGPQQPGQPPMPPPGQGQQQPGGSTP
jgi:sporulation protein YlmC with PRC-barrel domain